MDYDQFDADRLRIDADKDAGFLDIQCGSEQFESLLAVIAAHLNLREVKQGDWEAFRRIEIERNVRPSERLSTWYLVGCFLAAFLVLFLMIAGVIQTVRWFLP